MHTYMHIHNLKNYPIISGEQNGHHTGYFKTHTWKTVLILFQRNNTIGKSTIIRISTLLIVNDQKYAYILLGYDYSS